MFKINNFYVLLFLVGFSNHAHSMNRVERGTQTHESTSQQDNAWGYVVEKFTSWFPEPVSEPRVSYVSGPRVFYVSGPRFSYVSGPHTYVSVSAMSRSEIRGFFEEHVAKFVNPFGYALMNWFGSLSLDEEETELNLSKRLVNSSVQEIGQLSDWLKTFKELQKINLSNNQLNNEKIILIAKALESLGTLVDIDLKDNLINSDLALDSVVEMLEHSPRLQKFSFGNAFAQDSDVQFQPMSQQSAEKLVAALGQLSSLTEIDFHRAGIGLYPSAMEALADSLSRLPQLTALSLLEDQMDASAVNTLARSFESLTSLKKLDLSFNRIHLADAGEFICALSKLGQLRRLDLLNATFGSSEAAQGLAGAVLELSQSIIGLTDWYRFGSLTNNFERALLLEFTGLLPQGQVVVRDRL